MLRPPPDSPVTTTSVVSGSAAGWPTTGSWSVRASFTAYSPGPYAAAGARPRIGSVSDSIPALPTGRRACP
ncbi:hypothetical protein GCM10010429_39720 [Micromonospora olivasterospora]